MTKLAIAIEEAAKILKVALEGAREKRDAEYFKVLANAFSDLYKAFALMVAYDEVDPETAKRIEYEIFKEANYPHK